MKSAMIVEDVPAMGEWMQSMLKKAFPGISVDHDDNLHDARRHFEEETYNLALVDISLPDGDGIDLISQIRAKSNNTYIVMVTIFDDEEHLYRALKNGANGYLLKDLPEDIFIAKLLGILNGDPPLSPGIARKVLRFFNQEQTLIPAGDEVALSPREREVLIFIAKGFSRKEIARLLDLSPNTIARYVRDMYQKLNISSQAEAAIEACRLGYVGVEVHAAC